MPSRGARDKALAVARGRFDGSLAQAYVRQLKAIDFSGQIMLFGAGLLVSLLPFLILLSGFASRRIEDDISLRLGLDRQASGIVTQLMRSPPAAVNFATVTSLLFVTAGTLAVAGSLQQIYEKVFRQEHQGLRGMYRLLAWIIALCCAGAFESLVGRLVRDIFGGTGLIDLVIIAIWMPFFWWTMHFLLAGRVPWRTLLPAAIFTGVLFAGLGVFSQFYFSSQITSDSKTYGAIGAVFGIVTWFIAVGAVILLGAVAGNVWNDRKARGSSGRTTAPPPA
jgi:membrane protein